MSMWRVRFPMFVAQHPVVRFCLQTIANLGSILQDPDDEIPSESEEEEKSGSEEESSEDEGEPVREQPQPQPQEMTREQRRAAAKARKQAAIAKKQEQAAAQPGDLPPSESEEEDSDDDLPPNPNHTANSLSQAANGTSKTGDASQLTRREREAIEAQQARDRYMKLHLEGKTEEARADLARLAIVRERREAERARKLAEKEEKEARIRERAEALEREKKLREAAKGSKKGAPKKKK